MIGLKSRPKHVELVFLLPFHEFLSLIDCCGIIVILFFKYIGCVYTTLLVTKLIGSFNNICVDVTLRQWKAGIPTAMFYNELDSKFKWHYVKFDIYIEFTIIDFSLCYPLKRSHWSRDMIFWLEPLSPASVWSCRFRRRSGRTE